VYVLGHVLHLVGPGLLRVKFVPLAEVLIATGTSHPESAAVARHSLQCIYATVKEQEEVAWRTPQMGALTDILVNTATDPRPKVRKAAQNYLVQLMTEPTPAGELVRTSLEGKIVSVCTSTFRACTSTNTTESQQLLGMLRDISTGLSSKALQALSQHVLKLLANNERTMVGQIFNTLDSFLLSDCGSDKCMARMVTSAIQHQVPSLIALLVQKVQTLTPDTCNTSRQHPLACNPSVPTSSFSNRCWRSWTEWTSQPAPPNSQTPSSLSPTTSSPRRRTTSSQLPLQTLCATLLMSASKSLSCRSSVLLALLVQKDKY